MAQISEVRPFDLTSVPGLSSKARDAVSAVFDAMTSWQSETTKVSEKNAKDVFDKMAVAATALGWPVQIVETARNQMKSISEMQVQSMDHIRRTWEEQLKSPSASALSPDAFLSKLKSMPGFESTGAWPNAEAFQAAATNPMALWMEFGKQWQQFWLDNLNKSRH